MEPQLSASQMNELKEALFRGEKIAAIKLHRAATGAGLAEAKDAVDKLEQELRAASPELFAKPEARGCVGMLLTVAVAAAGILGMAALLCAHQPQATPPGADDPCLASPVVWSRAMTAHPQPAIP